MRALLLLPLLVAFSAALPRVRRDQNHDYSVDTLIEKVLPWLSDEQKAALKGLEGDKDALLSKIEEYFKATDKKGEAAEHIIKACRHIMADAIGDDKAAEIKKLKESGTGFDQLEAKVDGYIAAAADSKAKDVALKVKPACKKVFQWKHAEAAASRKRREVAYNLDLALEKVLTWLSDEQKAALKALEGDKPALLAKLEEYFKAISGDEKKAAVNKVKDACKHIFATAVGDDKIEEVKKIKESGGSLDDIEKKIDELLAAAGDSAAKKTAQTAKPYCKKAFAWAAANA